MSLKTLSTVRAIRSLGTAALRAFRQRVPNSCQHNSPRLGIVLGLAGLLGMSLVTRAQNPPARHPHHGTVVILTAKTQEIVALEGVVPGERCVPFAPDTPLLPQIQVGVPKEGQILITHPASLAGTRIVVRCTVVK